VAKGSSTRHLRIYQQRQQVVVERKTVQLARDVAAGKKLLDEVLRAVGGTRVADYPAVKMIGDGAEAALGVRGFIQRSLNLLTYLALFLENCRFT
jgi:hypothetical protein